MPDSHTADNVIGFISASSADTTSMADTANAVLPTLKPHCHKISFYSHYYRCWVTQFALFCRAKLKGFPAWPGKVRYNCYLT